MSLLRKLGLDSESPRWQRHVRIEAAWIEGFSVHGVVRVRSALNDWASNLEVLVRVVSPPLYSKESLRSGEEIVAEEWVKLARETYNPTHDYPPYAQDAALAPGEEAPFRFAIPYGREWQLVSRPDVVEVPKLRLTDARGSRAWTIELRRHFRKIDRAEPKARLAKAEGR